MAAVLTRETAVLRIYPPASRSQLSMSILPTLSALLNNSSLFLELEIIKSFFPFTACRFSVTFQAYFTVIQLWVIFSPLIIASAYSPAVRLFSGRRYDLAWKLTTCIYNTKCNIRLSVWDVSRLDKVNRHWAVSLTQRTNQQDQKQWQLTIMTATHFVYAMSFPTEQQIINKVTVASHCLCTTGLRSCWKNLWLHAWTCWC